MINERIIYALENGEKSTTEISSIIGRNYYNCLSLLEKLEEEGIIIKIKVRNFTFWKLKECKNEI